MKVCPTFSGITKKVWCNKKCIKICSQQPRTVLFLDRKLVYYNSTFLSNVIFSKYFVSDIIYLGTFLGKYHSVT